MTRDSNVAYIGRATSRVDGPLKLTGGAKYAAEYAAPGLLHGYVVSGAIAKGHIIAIDISKAITIPCVVGVLTHEHRARNALDCFVLGWRDVLEGGVVAQGHGHVRAP